MTRQQRTLNYIGLTDRTSWTGVDDERTTSSHNFSSGRRSFFFSSMRAARGVLAAVGVALLLLGTHQWLQAQQLLPARVPAAAQLAAPEAARPKAQPALLPDVADKVKRKWMNNGNERGTRTENERTEQREDEE